MLHVYGFLCLPRNISERLTQQNYVFEKTAAWLDLWCYTIFENLRNAFSYLAPTTQYGKQGAVLTLESLENRWTLRKQRAFALSKSIRMFSDCFV